MKPILTVYLRHGCHLCEAFMAELIALQARWQFEIETKDIDCDPLLRQCYDTRVPVLAINGNEICQYFLDPDKLADYFA